MKKAAAVNATPPEIASAPVPDTLAALHVNPDTGLTHPEVDVPRKEHGYNEVVEKKAPHENLWVKTGAGRTTARSASGSRNWRGSVRASGTGGWRLCFAGKGSA